jgi:hypothetical protein
VAKGRSGFRPETPAERKARLARRPESSDEKLKAKSGTWWKVTGPAGTLIVDAPSADRACEVALIRIGKAAGTSYAGKPYLARTLCATRASVEDREAYAARANLKAKARTDIGLPAKRPGGKTT